MKILTASLSKSIVLEIKIIELEDSGGIGGDLGVQFSRLTGNGASDGGSLGLSLRVDDDACVIFAVDEGSVDSSPGFALADDDGGHDFLSQVSLAFADGDEQHVSDGAGGELVKDSVPLLDGDNVEHFGTRVVAALELAADRDSGGDVVLKTLLSSSSFLSHVSL